MLIHITANQAHVVQMLVECMTPAAFPELEPSEFQEADAIVRAICERPSLCQRIAQAWRHVTRDDSG